MLLCGWCDKHVLHRGHDGEDFDDSSSASGSESYCSNDDEGRDWDSLFFPELFACCSCDASAQPPNVTRGKSRAQEPMSQSFRCEVDYMPQPEVPAVGSRDGLTMDEVAVPGMTLEAVRECLEEDDEFLKRYLMEFSKATDIDITRWHDLGGHLVQRARFSMPVPQDVPAAIARLASVPETSTATLLLSHKALSDDLHMLVIQQVTHDVPFGENFRVQEKMVLRRDAACGGVVVNKWTYVKWVKALSMMLSAVRGITESKIAKEAPRGGEVLVDVMKSSGK